MPDCKSKFVCPECGGDEITTDALARWSVETQAWELSSLLDCMSCSDCGYDSNDIDLFKQPITEGEDENVHVPE